jgi:cysteine sulfinate desulfinase/cysteine desulfurase-like protein
MGCSDAEARAAVRFSLSKDTTEEDVLTAASALAEIVAQMRSGD